MKIRSIETVVTMQPLQRRRKLGVGALDTVDAVVVRVTLDTGIEGFGECSAWPVFNDNAFSVKAAIDHYLTPAVLDVSPLDLEEINLRMDKALHDERSAKTGVEMAIFDAAGKALGCPAYDLLGGLVRDRVPLSYSVASQDQRQEADETEWIMRQGIGIIKIKTGVLSEREDIARVAALREVVGDGFDVRIDFNQGGHRESVLRLCRALEAFHPTFIEQPVKGWDIEGLAEIARALDTPVMADESVMSLHDGLKVIRAGAADIISIKIAKVGGIIAAKKLAAICESAGVPAYAGAMWESGIGIAASLHFACSTPAVKYGSDFYTASFLLEDDFLLAPLITDAGAILVPSGPGLGVDVDWDAVRRYAVEASSSTSAETFSA